MFQPNIASLIGRKSLLVGAARLNLWKVISPCFIENAAHLIAREEPLAAHPCRNEATVDGALNVATTWDYRAQMDNLW